MGWLYGVGATPRMCAATLLPACRPSEMACWQVIRAKLPNEITLLDIVKAIDGRKSIFECREVRGRCALFDGSPPEWALDGPCAINGAMMVAKKRMEEALAQQTILDIARKVGRKAPPEFGERVENWMNDRRDRNSASQGAPLIPLTDIGE